MSTRIAAEPVPHSWDLEHWPTHVYPHNTSRARWLIRSHRRSLIDAGVLTRIGREIVVLGARYSRWLESHSADVPNFDIAPNRAASCAHVA